MNENAKLILDKMLELHGFEKRFNENETSYYWEHEYIITEVDNYQEVVTIQVDKDYDDIDIFVNDGRDGGMYGHEAVAKFLYDYLVNVK